MSMSLKYSKEYVQQLALNSDRNFTKRPFLSLTEALNSVVFHLIKMWRNK